MALSRTRRAQDEYLEIRRGFSLKAAAQDFHGKLDAKTDFQMILTIYTSSNG